MKPLKSSKFFLVLSSIAVFILILQGTAVSWADGGRIPVALFDSAKMHEGAPSGWQLIESYGTPNIVLQKKDDHYVLCMKSDNSSSFGIKRPVGVRAGEYKMLNWNWKVLSLPEGADVRNAETDDQAIQIYVAFESTGWPERLNTPVIGYIWGVECPKETLVTSSQPFADNVRYIVIRNKEDDLGSWYLEKRNLEDDFRKLFPEIDGGTPRDIREIAFYINSQNTESGAESYICNVYLSKN